MIYTAEFKNKIKRGSTLISKYCLFYTCIRAFILLRDYQKLDTNGLHPITQSDNHKHLEK